MQGKLCAHPSVADHTLADMPEAPAARAAAAAASGKRGAASKAGAKASAAAKAKAKAAGAHTEGGLPQPAQPVLLMVDTAGYVHQRDGTRKQCGLSYIAGWLRHLQCRHVCKLLVLLMFF